MDMRNLMRLLVGVLLTIVPVLTSLARAQTTPAAAEQPSAPPAVSAGAVAAPAPAARAADWPYDSMYGLNSRATARQPGAVAILGDRPLASWGNAILLVPSGQPQPERIVSLNEDLTVMCRIFERLLTQAGLKGQSLAVYELFFTDGGEDRRSGFLGSGHTECLYVEGYGPLFLMSVDFPLTPPPQDQVENDADGPTDSLWNQVRQETYAPRSRRGARSGEPRSPYGEEKVRLLKETLIRALKHAANIRGLDRDAWLTVTARGPRAIGDEPYARTGRGGRTRVEDIYGGLDVYTGVATAAPAQPAAMLTIRAKVRDVSAVASGELELDEFRKHIEITEY